MQNRSGPISRTDQKQLPQARPLKRCKPIAPLLSDGQTRVTGGWRAITNRQAGPCLSIVLDSVQCCHHYSLSIRDLGSPLATLDARRPSLQPPSTGQPLPSGAYTVWAYHLPFAIRHLPLDSRAQVANDGERQVSSLVAHWQLNGSSLAARD